MTPSGTSGSERSRTPVAAKIALAEPPYTLEVDPATIHNAVALFERYAIGTVSIEQVGRETGLEPDRIRYILRNPLYNGWIRRHRGAGETRRPAAWRTNPPVSDELWARVEDARRSKTQGGGPRRSGHLDLLSGLLECVCGRRLHGECGGHTGGPSR